MSTAAIRDALAGRVQEISTRYPTARSAIMPALELAQEEFGPLDGDAYEAVAGLLDVPEIWVFEVASFYTLFDRSGKGRYHLQLCTNVSCMLRGAEEMLTRLEQRLGVRAGETTADGIFTLSRVECIGACDKAPAMMVNADYYEDLSDEALDALLDSLSTGAEDVA